MVQRKHIANGRFVYVRVSVIPDEYYIPTTSTRFVEPLFAGGIFTLHLIGIELHNAITKQRGKIRNFHDYSWSREMLTFLDNRNNSTNTQWHLRK